MKKKSIYIFIISAAGVFSACIWSLHTFHVVLIIWMILHFDWKRPVKRVFVELGDKSMIMWFVQGFLAVYMFAEYMLQLRWPLLIWIVWTIICYVVACLLKPVINGLARLLRLS